MKKLLFLSVVALFFAPLIMGMKPCKRDSRIDASGPQAAIVGPGDVDYVVQSAIAELRGVMAASETSGGLGSANFVLVVGSNRPARKGKQFGVCDRQGGVGDKAMPRSSSPLPACEAQSGDSAPILAAETESTKSSDVSRFIDIGGGSSRVSGASATCGNIASEPIPACVTTAGDTVTNRVITGSSSGSGASFRARRGHLTMTTSSVPDVFGAQDACVQNAFGSGQNVASEPLIVRFACSGNKTGFSDELRGGQNPNQVDQNGRTALIWAAFRGDTDVVQQLITARATVDVQDVWGFTALMVAVQNEHTDIVSLLLKARAGVELKTKLRGNTALTLAVEVGNASAVQLLIEAGAKPNVQRRDGVTALMLAADRGDGAIAEQLLNAGADPNIQEHTGWTALMYTAQRGDVEVAQLLLEQGAQPEILNDHGERAVDIAQAKHHFGMVGLLENWAQKSVQEQGASCSQASGSGSGARVRVADRLTAANQEQADAFFQAVADGNKDHVMALLPTIGNPNIKNQDGQTALLRAIQDGHVNVARALILAHVMRLCVRDEYGRTAFMLASERGLLEVVRLLLGAHAGVNVQGNDGSTALMLAAQNGWDEVAEMLVDNGAFLNAQKVDGGTALMLAAQGGHAKVVGVLIAAHAQVDVLTNKKLTALMIAAAHGRASIVRQLLEAGANPELCDADGKKAVDFARLGRHDYVVRMFREHAMRHPPRALHGGGGTGPCVAVVTTAVGDDSLDPLCQ